MSSAAKLTTSCLFLLVVASACSSSFVVRSEPSESDVLIGIQGVKEPKSMGKTPINITTSELQEKYGLDPSSGDLLEVTVKKNNYKTEKFLIPASRMVTRESLLFAKLIPGNDNNLAAQDALQHLLNAQRFSKSREYERAHLELDKAITILPEFPRAVSMRATLYFLQKRYDESLKAYEAALKLDPSLDDAIKMIAYLRKNKDRVPAGTKP